MSILVVGSSNIDLCCKVNRLPQVGETIFGENITYKYGGKGGNQAVAASKMNSKVTFLTCVGTDEYGENIRENYKNNGIDTNYIKYVDDISTGLALINIDDNGQNTIVVNKGANDYCDVNYLIENEKLFEENDYILLQMEIPIESIKTAIKLAKKYNKQVILNPAPVVRLDKEIFRDIDFLTPNETELELLAYGKIENRDILDSAEIILNWGVKNLIVTLGEKGAVLFNNTENKKFSAEIVEALDTVAAGDCFNGVLTSMLDEGKDIETAIEIANKAASISVTREGAQDSLPSREEVKINKETL